MAGMSNLNYTWCACFLELHFLRNLFFLLNVFTMIWLSVLDKYCPSWDFSSFSVVINFLYFSNIPFDFFIEFLAVYCCLSSGTLFQFPELIHYHWRKVLFQIVLSPKLQMYLEKHFANCTTEVQSPDESRSTPVKVQQFFVLAGAGWTAR